MDLMLKLLKYDYVKILLNIYIYKLSIFIQNVYNEIEYYYIKEKELLFDINVDNDDE